MKLFENLKALWLDYLSCIAELNKEPQCTICNDSKNIEVIVMGTDTDYVECPYCSDKDKYQKFQEHYKSIK